jgi:uncharacterized protein (DUF1810 family)
MPNDSHGLQRFIDAQDPVYASVLGELRAGEKRGHWMWFIFPQLRGLGQSPMAQRYGIRSLDEAMAYLRHPVLGPRLIECTRIVNGLKRQRIDDLFPYPDDLKFRSSMTLFHEAAPEVTEFREALDRYYAGEPDARTLQMLT